MLVSVDHECGPRSSHSRSWHGLAATQPGCSRNPATGKVQAFLSSEDEEVALGKESDAEILESMSLYGENDAAAKLVNDIGQRIAKVSERPELPWTFRLLDDPSVNAFALPGGYDDVTRGLMEHMNSADELAAVIGHECGHVTARHGAVQLRKQRIPEMFSVLAQIDQAIGAHRSHCWPCRRVHPAPDERKQKIAGKVGAEGRDVADERYFQVIDKMVYGLDPRNGFFVQPSYGRP